MNITSPFFLYIIVTLKKEKMKNKIMVKGVEDIKNGIINPYDFKIRHLKDSSIVIVCKDFEEGKKKLEEIAKDKKKTEYDREQYSLDCLGKNTIRSTTLLYIHRGKVKEYGYLRDMTSKERLEKFFEDNKSALDDLMFDLVQDAIAEGEKACTEFISDYEDSTLIYFKWDKK